MKRLRDIIPKHGPLISQYDIWEMIRKRAYELWQKAGEPPDDGVTFWLEAEENLCAYVADWSFWRKQEDKVAPNPDERSRNTAPDGYYRIEKTKP